MTSPNVCVGDGLDVDEDGRLFLDVCSGGGLCFGADGCVRVCSQDLHRATLSHTGNLTVPASAGSTIGASLPMPYNTSSDVVGGIATPPSITIARTGLYLVVVSERDTPGPVNFGTTELHTISISAEVNGVPMLQSRGPRLAQQTHVLTASRVMRLLAGDVITATYSIHSQGGPTSPHQLPAAGDVNYLQAIELPVRTFTPT